MSSNAATDRFSFSLTTFSPTGKLVQIEYALKAVLNGHTSIGIKTKEGIVLAAEKKLASPLIDVIENRIALIAPGLGLVYSGMSPDAKLLIAKARKIAQHHWMAFREYPTALALVKGLASVIQEYTQSGYGYVLMDSGVRPFGVSLLVAGFDDPTLITNESKTLKSSPHSLYQVDPSGTFWQWRATAIGKNTTTAKAFLERRYQEDSTLEDAIHTAILAIKEGYEASGASGSSFSADCIEIGILRMVPFRSSVNNHIPEWQARSMVPEFTLLSPTELTEYLESI